MELVLPNLDAVEEQLALVKPLLAGTDFWYDRYIKSTDLILTWPAPNMTRQMLQVAAKYRMSSCHVAEYLAERRNVADDLARRLT